MNIFQIICYILALAAFIKVFAGVFFHHKFYSWAQNQYSSEKRTTAVNLLLIYALGLLIAVWVGTIFFYITYGWILTATITLISLKSLNILLQWKKTSEKFEKFIAKNKARLRALDFAVALIGVLFLWMGIFLY